MLKKAYGLSTPNNPEPSEPTVPAEPLNGELIKSLTVKDTANISKWSIQQNLQTGSEIFGDRTFRFTAVPEQLTGAEYIVQPAIQRFTQIPKLNLLPVQILLYISDLIPE